MRHSHRGQLRRLGRPYEPLVKGPCIGLDRMSRTYEPLVSQKRGILCIMCNRCIRVLSSMSPKSVDQLVGEYVSCASYVS